MTLRTNFEEYIYMTFLCHRCSQCSLDAVLTRIRYDSFALCTFSTLFSFIPVTGKN